MAKKFTAKAAGYDFSARSRSAMADAIESIGHSRYYRPWRFPFCFNVKLWDGYNSSAINGFDAIGAVRIDGDAPATKEVAL